MRTPFFTGCYAISLPKGGKYAGKPLIKQYTVRELLQEMQTLTKIKYSGRYGHILTELTKSQREILQALKIELPGKI